MAEFELIDAIARRVRRRRDVAVGIGDDAALLNPPPGYQLAITQDTLNESVHFRSGDDPEAIGCKAAAVNLSDLAAMAAEPAWCTLSLALPDADRPWLDAFLDGFTGLLAEHDVALVGGDTTRGPCSISVTLLGLVPEGQGLRRDAGKVGDDLWVTGSLGDAAAGLAGMGSGDQANYLRGRLLRPQPRIAAGLALRRHARACIDVSDGLLADLGHVLRASGVGAELWLSALPASPALQACTEREQRWQLQCAGGDDYELLFSAAPVDRVAIERLVQASGTPVARIGRLVDTPGCLISDPDGQRWQPSDLGYQHFQTT
ncbi:thiamine-phosphate kinase [Pseudomarimonas arenosa]|uniref:Thiamine-monophosphate kinase n=1 Tax=Pseudomarimonas arenosa TaxID=2774145 RepID=A0AAW3ZJD1_9GAMM|nr:thiamine-phosphate kinase [Pseudomarimonas arenosa]MBD8525040.1 thiamine-phosphate kinase [Pseudomarimonas arenosa]